MAKLNDSIREKARAVVDEALEENRENWRAWIEEHTDKVVLNQRAERGGFHLRLQARWDKPLRYLELLYWLALDGGATAHERYSPQADEEDDLVFQVLVRLHARACSIGSEVISLLRTGHAAGAMARWRALHETTVIALFIKEHGHATAEKYLAHEVVHSRKGMREYQEYCSSINHEPFAPEVEERLEQKYEELKEKHGKVFKQTYGWAEEGLRAEGYKGRPHFRAVEESVGLGHMRPYYRMASHGIHAGPKAITFQLGLIEPGEVLLAGPSNTGLADPGSCTTLSLCQVTVALLTYKPEVDLLALSQELLELSDRASDAFLKVQQEIEGEEMRLREEDNGEGEQ